jgi:hypothetical protein
MSYPFVFLARGSDWECAKSVGGMKSSAQSLDNLSGLAENLATSKTDGREENEEIEDAERIKVLFHLPTAAC